jgi:regulator of protease activity HflC (stomatin/prohibitin superfamily)
MLTVTRIRRHERGLLYNGGDFEGVLLPGTHWVWGFDRDVEVVSLESELEVTLRPLRAYLENDEFLEHVIATDLSDAERALVWVDGRVHGLLGPGQAAFWKGLHQVRLEVFGVGELRFTHPLLDRILGVDSEGLLQRIDVPAGRRGMLYRDNVLVDELGPGRYAFWRGVAQLSVDILDLRETPLEVSGQEILTADKVSLRINLSATYQVLDPRKAVEHSVDLTGSLYRDLQLALRQSVGLRKLDDLLADKDAVSREVRKAVSARAEELGVRWGSVGVRDIILPGDMKVLLNQVIEAEKRAKANLIQRREETAATRSLLNTAKLIESSPTLLRLKELEAAERIAASIDSIQVIGGGIEGLVRQILPQANT